MRRRRQRNPLLGRIVGISILAHVIALPILAQFGAFKKIQEHFIETRLVTLPPPPVEKTKPEVKKTQKAARKPTAVAKKSATTTQRARQAAQKSNFSQPKVVASAGGPGSDNGPTVDANGTGKAGEIPTEKTDTKPTTEKEPAPQPKPEPKPEPKPAPEIAPAPNPEPKPSAPTPKPEPKREPILTEAVATSSPAPAIPDALRAEALDKTFVAEFTVAPDGAPSKIKVAQSTGNDELDRIALDAARQWRFKPATRDGQAVESRIRLHIEFQVT